MERIVKITKRLSVPDAQVAELKDEIRRIVEPGSWGDTWTHRAFERKWHMTVAEAQELVGKPV